jgi:hypothetical protein
MCLKNSVTRIVETFLMHLVKCHTVETFSDVLKMTVSFSDISRDIFWFTRDTILLI